MLHVSKCRFDRTRPRVGREREREKVRGGGGRRGRVDLLKEGRKERNKKKKRNQPNYPDELLFCSLSRVRLMNVKCCNLRVLIVTEKWR